MSTTTRPMKPEDIIKALAAICDGIIESVAVAGKQGAPGGVLYSAMMAHGCSLAQFQSLMGGIVKAGKLVQRGNLYFVPTCAPL